LCSFLFYFKEYDEDSNEENKDSKEEDEHDHLISGFFFYF